MRCGKKELFQTSLAALATSGLQGLVQWPVTKLISGFSLQSFRLRLDQVTRKFSASRLLLQHEVMDFTIRCVCEPFPNFACRYSSVHFVGRNIFRHNSPGCHDRSAANADPCEKNGTAADPSVG